MFKITIFEADKKPKETKSSNEADAFIEALGGRENILDTDACITRLRMQVKSSKGLSNEKFIKLGAKGVIRPSEDTIQIVLGTRAEKVAEMIKSAL
jgi:PTS system N-acetylglucosamine-specific IIC component